MKKIHFKSLIVNIAIPLAVGGLSYLLTKNNMETFSEVAKPPLTPSPNVFPIVWTALYTIMGIASYLIYEERRSNSEVTPALRIYALQLALNLLWSILFFNLKWYFVAFIDLILLWSAIFATIRNFYDIRKLAAYMLIPYLLWVSFAGYINAGVVLLN